MEKRLVPELRFGEFKEDWKYKKIGNIATKVGSGKTPKGGEKVYTKSGIPFIRSQNVNNNQLILDDVHISEKVNDTMKSSIVIANDILLNITGGSIGRTCVVPNDFVIGNVNQHVSIIRLKKDSPKFFQSFLSSWKGEKLIYEGQTGSGREGINFESIKNFKIASPSIPEQQKISVFLTSVDSKIEKLEQKKEKLEAYKKGVMQKLFSQELRFKDENGKDYPDWEPKKLNEVFIEHKIKNSNSITEEVFSVSKSKGVINQIEHLGRSYSAKTIFHYKVAFPNDVIYTKSPTSGFPFGIIKQNLTERAGVVSPLYVVLKPETEALGFILHNYFSSWVNTYNYLNPLVQKGAKNTMNINNDDFLNGAKIKLPVNEEEQLKVANFLKGMDKKIELVNVQLEKTKAFKKGLLQKMFV